jgi:hypothetical protein
MATSRNRASAIGAIAYTARGTVMRTLASLIVVCLVAATGVRPVAARDQPATLSAPRKVEKLPVRAVHTVVPRRTASDASALPAIVTVCVLAVVPPAASHAEPVVRRSVVVASVIPTRSARGPPVV